MAVYHRAKTNQTITNSGKITTPIGESQVIRCFSKTLPPTYGSVSAWLVHYPCKPYTG